MLLQKGDRSARRAVHLIFTGEKVREDYPEPAPELGSPRTVRGIRLIALPQLVRMKLTSFGAKDETHIKDLDDAGMITPEVEAELPPVLFDRLARARARD